MFETLSIPSKTGFTPAHAAAETGQLNKIPVEQLTPSLLVIRNDNGDTPLHAAAYEGFLYQVPASVLTHERMGTRNYDGISVAALAADRGHLSQIPQSSRPKTFGPVSRLLRRISRTRTPF